ncbi:hypothetical protein BN988_02181 [Oceanobacillus picturae]|uniref:Uncharacterized protein n=1 Tax=Oceanobacillus picturae TaxID=171693 RepID=W9ADW6_9BACI|nr:hypothetical protein [Oceanobacillus picturae]CDO03663.1 hypothetical protein BN988_02181 [Oceanobacillus picturae]
MTSELIMTYSGNCVICDKEISTDKYMCDKCQEYVFAYSVVGNKPYVNEQIGCPQCSEETDSELWDSHTVNNWATDEIQLYPWIIIKKEIHEKMGLRYRCPSCNQVIPGARLIRY